jgi:predicted nucleic acid-binding protein
MSTALDTNVVVALLSRDSSLNFTAQRALDEAQNRGSLLISAPVFAELLAFPGRDEEFVNYFLRETRIQVEWELSEAVWRSAGHAFQSYVRRRRKQRDAGPRRILADFVVGAHAWVGGHALLTLDSGLYGSAFPKLKIIAV